MGLKSHRPYKLHPPLIVTVYVQLDVLVRALQTEAEKGTNKQMNAMSCRQNNAQTYIYSWVSAQSYD